MKRAVVVVVVLVACGKVSSKDAHRLLETLAASSAADPSLRQRVLYRACADIASCADGCESALGAAAASDGDDQQAGVVLASCFGDLKKAHAADPKLLASDWFRGYFTSYVARARQALEPEEQRRLDALADAALKR